MSKVRGVVGVANIEGRDEIDPFLGVLGVGRDALGGGVRRSKPIVLLQLTRSEKQIDPE
jgi:hypothetical protein